MEGTGTLTVRVFTSRAQLPVEIKRAQELLSARDKFVEDAKRDVDRMMRQAELEAALEEKTERWVYLNELKEQIDAQNG